MIAMIQDRCRKAGIAWFTVMLIAILCYPGQSYAVILKALTNEHENTSEHSLDSIALQSSDVYCRGDSPILTVRGENVSWYADSLKNVSLTRGNTYQPWYLDSTTTFYLTQTIQGVESGVTPIEIEIVEAFLLKVKATPASCGKSDGTLTVTGKGGTNRHPLRYKLNDGPLQLSGFFDNLAGGTYTLIIDVIGCFGSSEVKIEKRPTPVISLIDQVDPKCGNANGSIRIAAFGGNGVLTYSLNGQDFSPGNLFDNLNSGEFTVWVMDDSLCKVSQNVSLETSKKLLLNQIDIISTSCGKSNGKVTLPLASGNGILSFSITGRPEQQLNIFDSLVAGSYQVSAKDQDGCSSTQVVEVAKSQGTVIINISTQIPTCDLADGRITITAASLSGLYYNLDGRPYQQDSSFGDLAAKNYNVSVKDDAGCTAEQRIDLGRPCAREFYLPNTFTPNYDGINDSWAIFFSLGQLNLEALTIYNRWGEVVFHSNPGSVRSGQGLWDGSDKGVVLNGVFTYQLQVKLAAGRSHMYRGTVMMP